MMWPAFVVLTVVDGILLHELPPVRLGIDSEGMTLPLGIIVACFANLFLIGAVAPWLARRLAARAALAPAAPEEVRLDHVRDRTGTVLLVLGCAGVLAAGIGSREVVVSETEATEANARAVRDVVLHTGDPELIRNLETATTVRMSDDFFRTCLARDDRRRYFCLFVDTAQDPPRVTRDPSQEPNRPRELP
jgi:hypothetical protein